MGLHGINVTSLILIFLIVLLVFGSKRIRTVGEDLGRALKGFRKSVNEDNTSGDKMENSDDTTSKG